MFVISVCDCNQTTGGESVSFSVSLFFFQTCCNDSSHLMTSDLSLNLTQFYLVYISDHGQLNILNKLKWV